MILTDERVDLTLAILAHQKGFDVQCYQHCWVKTLDGKIIHNSKSGDQRTEQAYMQPTLSLLQRWLREKHKLHIEVLLEENAPYTSFYCRVMEVGKYFSLAYDGDYSNSYEIMLTQGIYFALHQLPDAPNNTAI